MIQDFVALDLETTGLSPARDRILEIGAVRFVDGVPEEIYSVLVDCRMQIPPRITQLTGISNEMLEEAKQRGEAVQTDDAVAHLLEFCGGLPLLGHNIIFDYSFVRQAAVNQKLSFEAAGIDTLKIARKVLPELPERSLDALCRYYGIARCRSHRAQDDAMAAAELYGKLSQSFEETHPQAFLPQQLTCRAKKQSAITNFQKAYLIDLVKYHKINLNVSVESLTKNDASRLIDNILFNYGKIKR